MTYGPFLAGCQPEVFDAGGNQLGDFAARLSGEDIAAHRVVADSYRESACART